MSDNIFRDLAAPIPKHLVKTLTTKYKDKKTGEIKSFSVSYITARTVMNRLDEVVGPENWKTEFTSEGLPPKTILCTLYIRVNGEWLSKSDVGTMTDVEPEKGMVSDAIKRAAVHWGIARELYREGTANLSDDDDPAPDAVADDLGDVTWTRDANTLDRMVGWAETFKECPGKEHARNLICKALELETPSGDRDKFNAIMAAQYEGSKDDAIRLITAYEHSS